MMPSPEVLTTIAMMFGVMAVLLLIHVLQGPPPKEPPNMAE